MKALLTGACGGLGRELATRLAGCGVDLLLVDRKSRDLDKISQQISESGAVRPGVCVIDLAKAQDESYSQLSAIVSEHYGAMDLFVHCAAHFEGLTPIDHSTLAVWHDAMSVNLLSAMRISALLLPGLKQRKGRVVLPMETRKIFSGAYWGAYGISKGALSLFADMLESELEGSGVSVIRFHPGPMRTSLRSRAYLSEDPECLRHPGEVAAQLMETLGFESRDL